MQSRSFVILSALFALPLVVACGSDSSDSSAAAAAGNSAAGSSSGGSAGTSAGGAGAGGATAGSAGMTAAGAAGTAGAAGGPVGTVDLAGCTDATAVDKTGGGAVVTAGVGGFKYSPACIKVKVGSSVAFMANSAIHPLVGMSTAGTQPNPIGSTPATADKSVTFDAEGTFGFFCANHGGDGSTSGMVGAVYVVP